MIFFLYIEIIFVISAFFVFFFSLFPLDLSYVHVETKFEKTFLFISLVWNYILLTCCYWDTKKLLALRLSTLIDGQFSLKKLLSFKDEYIQLFYLINGHIFAFNFKFSSSMLRGDVEWPTFGASWKVLLGKENVWGLIIKLWL
jgi:hypothetical protein